MLLEWFILYATNGIHILTVSVRVLAVKKDAAGNCTPITAKAETVYHTAS